MANTQTEARLVAELNDLLQLDHDAVQAYGLAIKAVENAEHRESLTRFRADHQRHVENLTELIATPGGKAIQLSHIPTGPMKLAVQAAGSAGGDREVLLAFRSNERQVRDKYQRMADGAHPPDVSEVLSRNAADEARHYAWASEVLERMGAGEETPIGRAEGAFEAVHSRSADAVEAAERSAITGAEATRRSLLAAVVLGLAGVLLLRRVLK